MNFLRKHAGLVVLGLVIAAGSYSAGFHRGESAVPSIEAKEASVDFAPFWKVWNLINEKYVPASTTAIMVTNERRVWGAIQGLASSLGDPYTVFFPPVESEIFASEVRGNFGGVGMEVLAQEGAITVIAPLKDSPASRSGIQARDRIIKIGEKDTATLTTEEAVQLIRGPRGTTVSLTLVREGVREPLSISITREIINIPIINTEQLSDNVFKIDLYSFSENSPDLFRSALREFVLSGNDKLILDLRGNPGGYLEAAIDMASWFLPANRVVVKEDFGGSREPRIYRSRGYDIFNENLKFVVLVDKGSASASEILAGALQEHGKAIVVGEKTFGKGSVQELIDITKDTTLKITVARWLTPNGKSISETGVTPDYVVTGADMQLKKAIEILSR